MQHDILRKTLINHFKVSTTLASILASILLLSTLSTSTQAEQAFRYNDELIKLAKEFDDPATRYLVGRRFYKGTDYPQDKKQAAHWYQLAANAGHIKAQHYLGLMFLQGDGIDKNYELGKKYLKKAANQDYPDSMLALGNMYRLGVDGKNINEKNAVYWYKKAAELEDVDAAYYYGILLYEGRGVKQQKDAAMEWLQLSAELGYPAAERYLEKISNGKISNTSGSTNSKKNSQSNLKINQFDTTGGKTSNVRRQENYQTDNLEGHHIETLDISAKQKLKMNLTTATYDL